MREAIRAARARYAKIFVAYADCGTGGRLDAVLQAEEGVERLPGAHCYEFFATAQRFSGLAEQEPGTFYLTDFLVRHFERLVAADLGIDRHPELIAEYFRNYRRVVYLVQEAKPERHRARARDRPRMGFDLRVSLSPATGSLARVCAPWPRARTPRHGHALIIISWRDIPAQVVVKHGRETAKVQLTHRFQEAVDRAAMRAGKGSSDAYLADWKRSDPAPCGGDLKAERGRGRGADRGPLQRRGSGTR